MRNHISKRNDNKVVLLPYSASPENAALTALAAWYCFLAIASLVITSYGTYIRELFIQVTMSFEPKQKVELDPPKDDVISTEYLAKCDGLSSAENTTTIKI